MTFDIYKEYTKLIQVIDDSKFDPLKFTETNCVDYFRTEASFLWQVLKLTIKYPQVELYLKNLLNHFTIDKLENFFNGSPILCYMCSYPFNISLNTFEIIINCGININFISRYSNAAVNQLVRNQCNNHINNILNLLIKYNVNLNNRGSILDMLSYSQIELNEETKNCIITIIDSGGRTNKPKKNNAIYDFIEYYKCSTIKPAIKNENKI